MPGTFGFSSDPGGRIACVHRSTIMRPEVEACVGLSFLPLRFRFFVGCFLVGPSEVQSVCALKRPGSGRLVEAARIELASEAASRKTSTSVLPVLHLTCPAPLGADPDKPVAVLSPPGGRDARQERVSGVYAGRRSC